MKEAIIGATHQSTILFRINDEATGYQQLLFEDGIFVIQCRTERFWTNVGDIANFKIETIIPSTGLPFSARKNIKDHQPKLQQYLKKINDASGKEFNFIVDFEDVYAKVISTQSAAQDRLGEILYESYLSNITSLYDYCRFKWSHSI